MKSAVNEEHIMGNAEINIAKKVVPRINEGIEKIVELSPWCMRLTAGVFRNYFEPQRD